jgi:rhodanese-related sulfurtransferase
MKSITPTALKQRLDSGEEIQIIDIREEHERAICHIDGEHMPMSEVLANVDSIRRDIPVVIHCRSGKRSEAVIHTLEQKFGFTNLYNLEGGILLWADEVDANVEKY